MNHISLATSKFNMMIVIEEASPYIKPSGLREKMVKCKCDCGNIKTVRYSHLKTGRVKSCGCLQRKLASKRMTKHGECNSDEYKAWAQMKSRCYNKNYTNFKLWGGRGIVVCDKWRASFGNFLKDMGRKPSKKHSLDRINNDKGYSLDNCRWATRVEQSRNQSRNNIIEFAGTKKCLQEWSECTGINRGTISSRLRRGWSINKSLTTKQ